MPIASSIGYRYSYIVGVNDSTIFSICGKVCSSDRHDLSGESVNMLTSLYYWLKEEHCYESRKDAARKAKDERFCKISFDLIIEDGVEDEDDTTGEDEEY